MLSVHVKLVSTDVKLPTRATEESAGWDLYAYCPETPEVYLPPGERRLVSTGIQLEIPSGFEGQIRPRSGMAHKEGLVACFGTIDSDYRGVLSVNLFNHSYQSCYIKHGQRIAQIVFKVVPTVNLIQVDSLSPSKRGESGFGSSGR